MGEVFLAEDTELDRKVALKFLPPYYTSNEELKSRIRREAKAAAALNIKSDYIDFLVSKYSKSNEMRKKLKFDWEGGLSVLTEQYNSVELQHQAMEWR